MMVALLHLLAFTAAGILSSHFTRLGNNVLLARSPGCVLWGGVGQEDKGAIDGLIQDFAYLSHYQAMAQLSTQ